MNKRRRVQASSVSAATVSSPEDLIDETRRQEILFCFKTAIESLNEKVVLANANGSRNELLPISYVKKALKQLQLVGLKSDDIKSYFDDSRLEKLDACMFLRFAAFKSIQLEKSCIAFRLMDEAKKGVVVFEDLHRVCLELGEDFTEDELIEMIEFSDSSGEGLLRPNDFFRIAHNVNL